MSDEPYHVRLTRPAQKDLRNLGKGQIAEATRIISSELQSDPSTGERLSENLAGVRSLHFSLKGSGQYRAAYVLVEQQRLCLVFLIGTRENFYTEAERRADALRKQQAI